MKTAEYFKELAKSYFPSASVTEAQLLSVALQESYNIGLADAAKEGDPETVIPRCAYRTVPDILGPCDMGGVTHGTGILRLCSTHAKTWKEIKPNSTAPVRVCAPGTFK